MNGQQVSYNPKHITYMYTFYAVIRLDHPYIPSMRIQLNNNAVQIPNEGERLRNKIGLRLAEYLLDLPIRDVTKMEKIYSNNSLKAVLTRNPYAMPDYSYGFKCSLRNRQGIERYGYYLLMTQEVLETVKQMKTAPAAPAAPAGSAVRISFSLPYMDPEFGALDIDLSGELSAECALGTEYVQTVAKAAIIGEIQAIAAERCSWRDLSAQGDRLRRACETAFSAQNVRLIAFPTLQIGPDEGARRKIELLEKRKAMAAMTPEEFAKRMEEAQRQAQAAILQTAENPAGEQTPEKAAEQPAQSVPKFCPNCGAPTNGAKFCSSCGTKL